MLRGFLPYRSVLFAEPHEGAAIDGGNSGFARAVTDFLFPEAGEQVAEPFHIRAVVFQVEHKHRPSARRVLSEDSDGVGDAFGDVPRITLLFEHPHGKSEGTNG
jgi:hypothetical protein